MAQADKYPFLQFSVGTTVTLTGATTATITLAAAPTGLPSTTIRVYNNGTAAAIGTIGFMAGTVTAATIANAAMVGVGNPATIFSLGGQTVIQLVSQATTGTVQLSAGQGGGS